MDIKQIKKYPTTFDDRFKGQSHESVLRSYQILQMVKEMSQRGDSQETILALIDFFEALP